MLEFSSDNSVIASELIASDWLYFQFHKKVFQVLVHCNAGVSRSPTIVLSYIMRYDKMTLREALEHVNAIRKGNSISSFIKMLEASVERRTVVDLESFIYYTINVLITWRMKPLFHLVNFRCKYFKFMKNPLVIGV